MVWGGAAARELGYAHETTSPTADQRTMDLHNNDLGIYIASNYINSGNTIEMTEGILIAIANGGGLRFDNGILEPTDGTGRR